MFAQLIKPFRTLDIEESRRLISNREIILSEYALIRLNENQKRLFTEDEILRIIKEEISIKVHLQINQKYVYYYALEKDFLKLVLEVTEKKVVIVTLLYVKKISEFS